MLRYWFIRGKMAQCKNEVDKAFEWYTRCEKILDQQLPKDTAIDLKWYTIIDTYMILNDGSAYILTCEHI